MNPPETRYTNIGASIAYQVTGDGPIDLIAGSEFAFEDRGPCALKGVPDQWQLYAVRQT